MDEREISEEKEEKRGSVVSETKAMIHLKNVDDVMQK